MSYEVVRNTIGYFRWHNQIDRVDNLLGLIKHLDEEEAELFDVDLRHIDNEMSAKTYMYGVGKYYCGLDLISPIEDLQQIVKLNSLSTGHDVRFAMSHTLWTISPGDLKAFNHTVDIRRSAVM